MSVPGGKADLAAAAEEVWNCSIFRVAMLLTDDGWAYYVGGALLAFKTRGHLFLIEVKISGPHGAGQYLRRAPSACFLDFNHHRSRVDFRLRLSARYSNVIKSPSRNHKSRLFPPIEALE